MNFKCRAYFGTLIRLGGASDSDSFPFPAVSYFPIYPRNCIYIRACYLQDISEQ